MILTTVENGDGGTLELTPENGYIVTKIDGIASLSADIGSDDAVGRDGIYVNTVNVRSRNIVMDITFRGDVADRRKNLRNYFQTKRTSRLYFQTSNMDVYIDGIVESFECDPFDKSVSAQISIICPKPYLLDRHTAAVYFSNVNGLFEFPFSISSAGLEFGIVSAGNMKNVRYSGDVDTGATITLECTGSAIESPSIHKSVTNESMEFNLTLTPGDTLVVNTRRGERSIMLTTQAGTTKSVLGKISHPADWIQLTPGDNILLFSGTGPGHLTMIVEYDNLREGI